MLYIAKITSVTHVSYFLSQSNKVDLEWCSLKALFNSLQMLCGMEIVS